MYGSRPRPAKWTEAYAQERTRLLQSIASSQEEGARRHATAVRALNQGKLDRAIQYQKLAARSYKLAWQGQIDLSYYPAVTAEEAAAERAAVRRDRVDPAA
jgi:hypothetical protein